MLPPVVTPPTITQAAPDVASIVAQARAGMVASVNGKSGDVTVVVPVPASAAPPAVGSASATGTMTTQFALANHTHKSSVQVKVGTTDANGQVAVTWDAGFFSATPTPLAWSVTDGSGAGYSVTVLSISATGATYQVRRLRALPASLLNISVLSSYDPAPAAPAGLTVTVAAKGG